MRSNNIAKTFRVELSNGRFVLFRYSTKGEESGFYVKNNEHSIKLPLSMLELKELAEFILKL